MSDTNSFNLRLELTLTRAAYSALAQEWRPRHATASRLLKTHKPVLAEVELDRESSSYSIRSISRHRLPFEMRVHRGTATHTSLTQLIITELSDSSPSKGDWSEDDSDLLPVFKDLLQSIPSLPPNTLAICKRDLKVLRGPLGIPLFEQPSRLVARLKPAITTYDDGPTLTVLTDDADSLLDQDQVDLSLLTIVEPLSVEIDRIDINFFAEVAVPKDLQDRVDIFIHWGSYDDLSSAWRHDRASTLLHPSSGVLEVSHRIRILNKGNYGATLYARIDGIASPRWFGNYRVDDVRFRVFVDDTDRLKEQEQAITFAFASSTSKLQASLGSTDLFATTCARIHHRYPALGVGALLAKVGNDSAARRKMFALYSESIARDSASTVAVTIRNYGIGEVVFVAPEGPHAGAGGLSQVISGLLPELSKAGIPTTLIAPLFASQDGSRHQSDSDTVRRGITIGSSVVKPQLLGEVVVHLGPTYSSGTHSMRRYPASIPLKVYHAEHAGVRLILLHNPTVFDTLYRPVFADEQLRRAIVFSRGALEAMASPHFGIRPSFVISNDWMTGFIPGLSKLDKRYAHIPWLANAHFIHMLHNAGGDYHGKLPVHSFGEDQWPSLNLPAEHFFGFQDPNNDQLLNPTAAALRHANAGFLTVSKSYADQLILGSASDGLDGILWNRKDAAFGISNGISRAKIANSISQLPVSSIPISGNDREDFLLRKSAMKTALQRRFGLATQRDYRLISFVGRLAEQKGLHLLSGWAKGEGVSVLESILLREPQTQIIIAGPQTPNDSSVEELERLMRWLQHKFANRVVFIPDFISHALALEIIFGSDLFLMPSRFEPGGITQLEALAAGTLVVGRNVGGIGATIENIDVETESGTGFLCDDYSCAGFRDTLLWALDTLKNEELRVKLIDNARFADHDWSERVPKYRALFQHICVDGELLREAPWYDDHVKILQQILP